MGPPLAVAGPRDLSLGGGLKNHRPPATRACHVSQSSMGRPPWIVTGRALQPDAEESAFKSSDTIPI